MSPDIVRIADLELVEGELYIRREIHDRLGGQRQGGISTPAIHPVILLFTSETGQEHGYGFDGWKERGVFHYTGEGQPTLGDMRFTRGNRAIRDHVENGKRLLLFQQEKQHRYPRRVKFIGEMMCRGYHIEQQDTAGYNREVIVFELVPVN